MYPWMDRQRRVEKGKFPSETIVSFLCAIAPINMFEPVPEGIYLYVCYCRIIWSHRLLLSDLIKLGRSCSSFAGCTDFSKPFLALLCETSDVLTDMSPTKRA